MTKKAAPKPLTAQQIKTGARAIIYACGYPEFAYLPVTYFNLLGAGVGIKDALALMYAAGLLPKKVPRPKGMTNAQIREVFLSGARQAGVPEH